MNLKQGILLLALIFSATFAIAEQTKNAADVIKSYLQEATQRSGTLDIFDESINKVRNLKVQEFPTEVTSKDGKASASETYTDMNTGDQVELEFSLLDKDGQLAVDSVKITNIVKVPAKVSDVTYSEAQVLDFVKNDIAVKSKLSGTMSLFDPDKSALRELKLIEIKEGAKKFGDLYICRVNFEDTQTKELIGVDMQIKNEGGKLVIANIFIRERKNQ